MCRIKLKIKKREECCTMRGNLIFGLVAGSMVGAAAAVIAMPYVKPQVRRAIRKLPLTCEKPLSAGPGRAVFYG